MIPAEQTFIAIVGAILVAVLIAFLYTLYKRSTKDPEDRQPISSMVKNNGGASALVVILILLFLFLLPP